MKTEYSFLKKLCETEPNLKYQSYIICINYLLTLLQALQLKNAYLSTVNFNHFSYLV